MLLIENRVISSALQKYKFPLEPIPIFGKYFSIVDYYSKFKILISHKKLEKQTPTITT